MYFSSPAVLSEAAFQPQNFLHFLAFGATLMQTLLQQHAFFFQLSRCILADKSYIVCLKSLALDSLFQTVNNDSLRKTSPTQ